MNAKSRPSQKRERHSASGGHYRQLLEGTARILVQTGHSPKLLAREFLKICEQMKEPAHACDPNELTYLWDLPHIIAHWHSDPQYMDSRGKPIPLPLRGRGPSLAALIERVLPGAKPQAVAESLMELQGVARKDGLYTPSSRYFTYPAASARVHGFTALLGMLRTVEHNVNPRRRTPALLERTAVNPSFPADKVELFNRELQREADRLLWRYDAKMRVEEQGHRAGPTTRMGVGIFVFRDSAGRSKPAKPTRARR
jgi:Family of unknown function (DUF6502)